MIICVDLGHFFFRVDGVHLSEDGATDAKGNDILTIAVTPINIITGVHNVYTRSIAHIKICGSGLGIGQRLSKSMLLTTVIIVGCVGDIIVALVIAGPYALCQYGLRMPKYYRLT